MLWILNGGTIGASKAITVLERDIELPPLTEKDRQAIEIGNRGSGTLRCPSPILPLTSMRPGRLPLPVR